MTFEELKEEIAEIHAQGEALRARQAEAERKAREEGSRRQRAEREAFEDRVRAYNEAHRGA